MAISDAVQLLQERGRRGDIATLALYGFFFNDTATTEIYTRSLHDALPICATGCSGSGCRRPPRPRSSAPAIRGRPTDRKSTRLNSSHPSISYAVFCLKKKKTKNNRLQIITKKTQKQ